MTFPVDAFQSVNIELISDTRAPSQRYFRYVNSGNRDPYYMITMTTSPLEYAEGRRLNAYLNSLQGELVKFDLPNPIPPIFQHTNKVVNGSRAAGSSTVLIAAFTPLATSPVSPGEIVQFGTNPKAYEVLSCSNADSSGNVTITLVQPLISDVPNAAVVKLGANVTFRVRMVSRNSGNITANQAKYTVHDVELIEQA